MVSLLDYYTYKNYFAVVESVAEAGAAVESVAGVAAGAAESVAGSTCSVAGAVVSSVVEPLLEQEAAKKPRAIAKTPIFKTFILLDF
ncbi:MAG TPA: hypothetical protein VFL76_07890 [Edaphocola sp.]|nr:hypothetical protein [Edaphocola sp.]